MRLIFWNLQKSFNIDIIINLLEEKEPQIFFLAEVGVLLNDEAIKKIEKLNYVYFENPGCKRIRILKKKELNLKLGKQSDYYTSLKHEDVIVISVHLPSQLYQNIDALKENLKEFRNEIDSEFGNSLETNIVLVGDFNVNPFETPLIGFDGFSASNSINLRKQVTHLRKNKALYYNPTWMLYSNTNFPGTKHFPRPSPSSYDILEHHFLDQVLLSYSMCKKLKQQNIGVIEYTSKYTFLDTPKNRINHSDHLPLFYEYKIS